MHIVQINSVVDRGSTGHIVRDLSERIRTEGHACSVAYGQGSSKDPDDFKIGTVCENHFHNLFFTRMAGLHGYGTVSGTRKLLRWMDSIKPDVVHLHNLHCNYLHYPLLFSYLIDKGLPVVFTLNDCFNFTGKCAHYTDVGCTKWKTECHHCPLVRQTIAPSFFFDRSRMIFRQKKDFYSRMSPMTVVAVSQWLKAEAEQSILAGHGHEIRCIYNWVDSDLFRPAAPAEMESFRAEYNLPSRSRFIVSVSQDWVPGHSKYDDAVRLASLLPDDYVLILIGRAAGNCSFPSSVIHIPYIEDSRKLSVAYSLATAYAHFSVEDTFGKVIAEAMSCGAVPLVFDSTACSEIPGPYGFKFAPHDVGAMAGVLPSLSVPDSLRREMREYARIHYDKATNLKQYMDVYRDMASRKR